MACAPTTQIPFSGPAVCSPLHQLRQPGCWALADRLLCSVVRAAFPLVCFTDMMHLPALHLYQPHFLIHQLELQGPASHMDTALL